MKIGEIAQRSGFSKDTLRYYEKIGLIRLTKKQRSENNYRIYDDSILTDLKTIKKMKSIGFTLKEIKELRRMEELDYVSCSSLAPLIKNKLEKIEEQLILLQSQKQQLLKLVDLCQGECTTTMDKL